MTPSQTAILLGTLIIPFASNYFSAKAPKAAKVDEYTLAVLKLSSESNLPVFTRYR